MLKFLFAVVYLVIKMIYQVVVLLLLLCSINGVPIEEFLPFNGSKLCLIDAVSGMIHTSNVLDSNRVTIDELDRSKCDEFRLSPNDDAGSYNISISVTFPFFARQFKNVYVSTNKIMWLFVACLDYCTCCRRIKSLVVWEFLCLYILTPFNYNKFLTGL